MTLALDTVLNPEQAAASRYLDGPLLIIAGAGSGKTRMLTYRIAYMLASGIDESAILALTFTNKAAGEMRTRIEAVLGQSTSRLTATTFHAFGLSILKRYGTLIGYRPNLTIYDQQDAASLLKATLREMGMDPAEIDLYALAQGVSQVKTTGNAPAMGAVNLAAVTEEYNDHLMLYNACDFDDLIMQPLRLFSGFPAVLEYYRNRFRHILVDEFQDTSMQQYEIIRYLSAEHRNICVVGDDDQSIYSWRGADYRNITKFEQDFPECLEIRLEQNYRSTGTILTAANTLIRNNLQRKDKQLWTGNNSQSGTIALHYPGDEHEESDFISEKIRELRFRDQLRYNDFGVLVRTNSLLTQLEQAFLSSGIPYKVSGGMSFFQRKEIKDVISYLRVLLNPDDDMSLLRIMNTPRRGIGRKTLEQFRSYSEQHACSLFSAITAYAHAEDAAISAAVTLKACELIELIEQHRRELRKSRNAAAATEGLLLDIGYRNHIIAEHQSNESLARWKIGNIDLFLSIIRDWERNPDNHDRSIYTFLQNISLSGRNEPDQEEGKVNLMTIHAAKGLEFHTVFLAGVEDHIIPHRRAIEESADNLEEERRLFYVAITRAEVNLYITSCLTRNFMRERIETVPSRFIAELPSHLLEQVAEDTVVEADRAKDFFSQLRREMAQKE